MALPLALIGLGAKLSGVGKKLKSVPWQVWAVIALVIALGVGGCVVKNKIEAYGSERYFSGYDDGRESRDAEVKAAQEAKAEADRKLAAALREKVNAQNTAINNRADTLLVRGAGKATCPNPPAARTSAGGHDQAAPEADAPGLGVLTEDWAAVPWKWLVKQGREKDQCLVEAAAWREQHAAEVKAYEESQR